MKEVKKEVLKKTTIKKHESRRFSSDDLYVLVSKYEKEFTKLDNLAEIEQKYPLEFKNEKEKEKYLNQIHILQNLQKDIQEKKYFQNQTIDIFTHGRGKHNHYNFLLKRKITYYIGEDDGNMEKEQNPLLRYKRILIGLEKFKPHYNFSDIKDYSFNASLIVKNEKTKGFVLLGSNNYKNRIENLHSIDIIINIIGEYPDQTFQKEKVYVEEMKTIFSNEVKEYSVICKNGHVVYFYVKPNENFNSYHYLADQIQTNLWKGKRILVHCQMGQIRSATLMLFYLRKFFFNDVKAANEFIGFKRENAGAPEMLISNIEKLIQKGGLNQDSL